MGMGDELMAAGEAYRLYQSYAYPTAIYDYRGKPRWHDIWQFCPYIVHPNKLSETPEFYKLVNGPKCRPYINYKETRPEKWCWLNYTPMPAHIVLPARDEEWAERYRGCIVVNPLLRPGAPPNKDWGFNNYQKVVNALVEAGYKNIVQISSNAAVRKLRLARFVITPDYGRMLAILSVARAILTPEGGLHHAAAAFTLPAVVIFGGYISPDTTGYAYQRSLVGTIQFCGRRFGCVHCKDAMNAITWERVHATMIDTLGRN